MESEPLKPVESVEAPASVPLADKPKTKSVKKVSKKDKTPKDLTKSESETKVSEPVTPIEPVSEIPPADNTIQALLKDSELEELERAFAATTNPIEIPISLDDDLNKFSDTVESSAAFAPPIDKFIEEVNNMNAFENALQALEEKAKKAEEALQKEQKLTKELEGLNSKLLAEKTALLDSLSGEKGALSDYQERCNKLAAQKTDLDNQLRVSILFHNQQNN